MSFSHRRVPTNGIELHIAEAGPADGPLVLLCHGFPEIWYSWRHQIDVLADAGYHVMAPDQRGYGRSDRPEAITDYDLPHLTDDLLGLLDDAGQEQAVFVGHDWGAIIVWDMALRHPDRVKGVVGMSVPFIPRGPMAPIELFKAGFGDNFFYILYFQEPGVAEAELEADPHDTMRRTLVGISTAGRDAAAALTTGARHKDTTKFLTHFANPDTLPGWLSEEDVDHFAREFATSGFRGPLNYYRNMDRNWELNESFTGAKVEPPALFITGADDPVRRMAPDAFLDELVPNLKAKVVIDGAGHWVQQEKPAETNAALLDFLRGL